MQGTIDNDDTHTTILQLFGLCPGKTRVSWYQKVHFAIFWIFWCKMKITQADTPTIRMDCHPIQTNWCPHLCHPRHFYTGCPSWHNPSNLSWLGTGIKYAGLYTRWLGLSLIMMKSSKNLTDDYIMTSTKTRYSGFR